MIRESLFSCPLGHTVKKQPSLLTHSLTLCSFADRIMQCETEKWEIDVGVSVETNKLNNCHHFFHQFILNWTVNQNCVWFSSLQSWDFFKYRWGVTTQFSHVIFCILMRILILEKYVSEMNVLRQLWSWFIVDPQSYTLYNQLYMSIQYMHL